MDEATKEIVGEIEQEGASEQLEDNTEEVTLSVNALQESQKADTIKVFGKYKNRQLVILIDSGTTNSFFGSKGS